MKTQHYKINALFAKKEDIPTSFVAVELRETARALYVYGHGEIDPHGSCCVCGRTLTHPGSILLGIGPECLGNWGARDIRMEEVTKADKDYLRNLIRSRVVDCWIPKSIVKRKDGSEQEIKVPEDHKMLNGVSKDKKKSGIIKEARSWEGGIAIRFPYDADLVIKVKTLAGRKYHTKDKYWTCLLGRESIVSLKEWGFKLDEKLEALCNKAEIKIGDIKPIWPTTFKKKPYGLFQEEGVGFIEAKNGRALVADEMGLGKTIEALAYLELHPKIKPAIILCPASLKLNWAQEIRNCTTQRRIIIINGIDTSNGITVSDQIHSSGDIIIINYDILQYWVKYLKELNPQMVIADEAHYFKNNKAERTKAVKKLAKGIPHFLALTGTPIENRPIEIFNAINIVDSTVFPNFWKFAKRYCGAKHNGFGWDFNGASNTKELHEKLTSTIMIRRLKKDVLKDLPDKIRSFIPMELDNRKEYAQVENNFIDYIRITKGYVAAERASNAEILVQIEALKQAAVKGKLKSSIEWIRDFLDSSDEKLVVFAVHKTIIEALMEEFKGIVVKIDGSVNAKDRDRAIQAFQGDSNVRLFVGNIKAAGVGLTLTAASNVVILELPWTPGALEQAIDRLHRIGQKDSVTAWFLLAVDTIEYDIAQLLDSKRKVLDAVLDGKDANQESLLTEIINKYSN